MKKIILLFLIFFYNSASCQVENDTLILNQNDISFKIYTIQSNKTKPTSNIVYFNKENGVPLNGLCKIKINDNTYFITYYKNGIENNAIFNYKKNYQNGKLKVLDIKGYQLIGQNYLSILEYDCSSNVFLDGYTKDYNNETIIDKIRIYQKIKDNTIFWKIYYPDKTKGKLKFNKTSLDVCK